MAGRLFIVSGPSVTTWPLNASSFEAKRTQTTQEADIVMVATELSRTQTLYEMTLAASSRLLSMSLLDFLR